MRDFAGVEVQSAIAVVRADCVAAFAGLGERLGDVRDGLEGVGAQVSGLADLLASAGSGTDSRTTITHSCNQLGAELATTRRALELRTVRSAMHTAIEALDSISRQAKQLTAVSSITCVTARSTGAEALGDYVVSLRQMIDELADAVAKLTSGLSAIRVAHAAALSDVGVAEAAVSRAIERINRPKAGSAAPEVTHAALHGRFEVSAQALADATQRETGALITAIQFSDALSQRLEHVEQILANADNATDGARALAAAQITALAEDAQRTLDVLAEALARLAGAGSGAAAQLSARDGLEVEALLDARRLDLAEGTVLQTMLAPSLETAQDGADQIRREIEAARDGYKRLTETAAGVNLSAINATLLTARGGEARAAMAVLSESVRGSARDCAEHTAHCREAMHILDSAVEEARFPAITEAARRLRANLESCEDQLAAAESDLRRLSAMRDMAKATACALVEAINAGETSLSRALPAVARLHEAARVLDAGAPVGVPDAAMMAKFAALYTMSREREVHAAFCGTSLAEPVAESQELSDIFF